MRNCSRFYEDYRKTRFDKLAGEERTDIRVRFTGDAARLVKEYHARKADRLADENGAVLFEKKAAITPDIKSWLLSFGAQAEVLAPEGLKQNLKEEIGRMSALYREEQ